MMNGINERAIRIAANYIYTRALPEHIPQIHEIERMSFSDPWSLESFEKEFEDCLARYFVAIMLSHDGAETGFTAGFCGYWSVAGEAHITNVAVHPLHRGRGVGAGLVHAMLGDILMLGHASATLEVREDNYMAIRLYERFGFAPAGKRKKYYDQGKKDAIIMWKHGINHQAGYSCVPT